MRHKTSVEIIAHRGYSSRAPENTMPAFEMALASGVDAIELDVHLTADGRLAVIHDHNLKRLGSGDLNVGDLAYSQIASVDAGAWYHPRFTGTRIPLLEDVVELTNGRCGLNIEVKNGPVFYSGIEEALVECLEKRVSDLDRLLISSFDHRVLKRIKSLRPALKTAPLFACIPADLEALTGPVGAHAIHPHADLVEPELVERAHRLGIKVNVWTVNSPERAALLREMGVDGIITDDPDLLKSALKDT